MTRPWARGGSLPSIIDRVSMPTNSFIASIQNVEMRRPVVIEIHAYDDSVKSAKLRHCAPGILLPA